MRIGIIAAMQVELDLLLENTKIISKDKFYGRTIYHSKFKEHDLYMGVSGIGKANAASFTQLLLDKYEIELVINTGIAGAINPNVSTLDLVIADKLVYHDFPEEILKITYPFKASFKTDDGLVKLTKKLAQSFTNTYVGTIASADVFVAEDKLKQDIEARTKALACDMESAAIAQIAEGAGISTLIIRSISDEADDDSPETYDNFEAKAANLSVKILLEVLKEL